jgi:hypothetical protein
MRCSGRLLPGRSVALVSNACSRVQENSAGARRPSSNTCDSFLAMLPRCVLGNSLQEINRAINSSTGCRTTTAGAGGAGSLLSVSVLHRPRYNLMKPSMMIRGPVHRASNVALLDASGMRMLAYKPVPDLMLQVV